jgi:hypothetical protein
MKLDLSAKFLLVAALSLCQLIRTLPKKSDIILSGRRCRSPWRRSLRHQSRLRHSGQHRERDIPC